MRFQYVTSTPARSLKAPTSLPSSHSVLTSGFKSGLPRFSGPTPGPVSDDSALKVVSLENAWGWRPDCPTAARRRSVDSLDPHVELPQPARALGWTERLAFG